MKETNIMKLIQIRASELGGRLLRNNNAKGWMGDAKIISQGVVMIHDARRLHAGLGNGTGDHIGWTPVTITKEMVGKEIAVFTSVESKSKRGVVEGEQQDFYDLVKKSNGIAIIARSVPEFEDKIKACIQDIQA